jgi:hypothetical protein
MKRDRLVDKAHYQCTPFGFAAIPFQAQAFPDVAVTV